MAVGRGVRSRRGKRERGLLFLGPPGTGKTMLAKAIATGFNCPFVSMPGSGFQQAFMGMDAVIVRYLAWKAKRLAAKWGGQCIVFIDEIDAVGMRRSALGGGGAVGGMSGTSAGRFEDHAFYGSHGALNPSQDLILETRAWRDRLFEARAPESRPQKVGFLGGIVKQFMPGMMGGGMGQLALNQLLVVMDGIDNPPFFKSRTTNWVNTFLDASYVVPRRIGKAQLRLAAQAAEAADLFHRRDERADQRPRSRTHQAGTHGPARVAADADKARPARHLRPLHQQGRPRRGARLEKRRDEIARITNGYSPAMIEQVCSMALTLAHSDRRERFSWEDIVEAMTTIESGMAIKIEYVPRRRAVAIHEAGHAVAGHVYMKGAESTRLSIRRRGDALGHHQALEKEERFSSWRSEEVARLIWTLGAMAAERVFYGENSTGVGGDVQSATARAAWMVGACAMAPERIEINGRIKNEEDADRERKKIARRFEGIGTQIMNRSGGGGPMEHDPLSGVMMDRDKRSMACQLIGQAYVAAHLLIEHNREAVEQIADVLVERKELHGDEIVGLLDSSKLTLPEVDLTNEAIWPKL